MMNRVRGLSLAMITAWTPVAAQGGGNVFFVPFDEIESWCSGTTSCCAKSLDGQTVCHVQKSTCQDCARKLTTLSAWNTLMGDEDGDAHYFRSDLFGRIDALMIRRDVPFPDMRNMFVSVSEATGSAVAGSPLRPGDVARIVRAPARGDGQLEFFIRAEQVRSALGLRTLPNVDAIAQDDAGNIFLSLEEDRPATLRLSSGLRTFVLMDGGIAAIPAGAITYDAFGNVLSVTPRSGLIVMNETEVNGAVRRSRISDNSTNCIPSIGDLDALEVDPNGTTMAIKWDGATVTLPALAFAGSALEGLGVLTTAGRGQVLQVPARPCPLGRSCDPGSIWFGPTLGFEMGVQAIGGGPAPTHVNALSILPPDKAPGVLLLDTCAPVVSGPRTVTIGDLAGAHPRLLLVGLGPTAPSGVAASVTSPWGPNPSFPDAYLSSLIAVLPMPPTGELTLGVPAGAMGNLVMQQVELQPSVALVSTPLTLVIR